MSENGFGTSKITSIAVGASSIQVLKSNPNRHGLVIYNDAGSKVYVGFGISADPYFTLVIAPNDHWYCPLPIYSGVVSAVRNSGSGALLITELW